MAFNMSALLAFTTKGLQDNLNKGSASLKSFKKNLQAAGKQSRAVAKGAGRVALGGTIMAAGIGVAVHSHMQFEKQMASVTSKMKEVHGYEMALEEQAKRLGASTIFSATEAAQGLEYLALAGFTAKESIGVLPTILNTAAVGALDLGRASDIVTDSMSALSPAFDKNATKAARAVKLADMMSLAQARTNTNIEQLGEAIKFGGGAMANMEIPLQQIIGSMGALANSGIKGSMGGTSLVNMMNKLANPSKKAIALMDEMGLAQEDLMDPKNPGKLKDMASVMTLFENALKKQPDVLNRAGAASEIFGLRGQRAFFALANEGAGSLRELFGELKNSEGAADKMYKKMTDNLWGASMAFKSATQGMLLEVGKMVSEQFNLKGAIEAVTAPIQQLSTAFMALNKPADKWSEFQKQAMASPYGEVARGIALAFGDVKTELNALWQTAKGFFGTANTEKSSLQEITRTVAKVALFAAIAGPPVLALGAAFMFITPVLMGAVAAIQLMGTTVRGTMLILRGAKIALWGLSKGFLMVATSTGRATIATKLHAYWTKLTTPLTKAASFVTGLWNNNLVILRMRLFAITVQEKARAAATRIGMAVNKASLAVYMLYNRTMTGLGKILSLNTLKTVAMGVAQKAQAVWTGVVTAAQWAWNAAMTANPIGLIVVGIGALIAALAAAGVWVYRNWERVKQLWTGMGKWRFAIMALTGPIGWLIGGAMELATNWDTVSAALSTAWTWTKNLGAAMWEFTQGAMITLVDSVRQAWTWMTNFAQESQVVGFIAQGVSMYINTWKTAFVTLWETAKTVIATFQEYGLVMGAVKLGQMAFATATQKVGQVGDWLSEKWMGVIGVFKEAWSWIQKVTGAGVNKVMSFFGMGGAEKKTKTEGQENVILAAERFKTSRVAPLAGGAVPPGGAKVIELETAKKNRKAAEVSEQAAQAKAAQFGGTNVTVNQPSAELPVPEVTINVTNNVDEDGVNSIVEKSQRKKANQTGKQTLETAPEKQSQVSYGT